MRRTLTRVRLRLRAEIRKRPLALPSTDRIRGQVHSVATEAGLDDGDYVVVAPAERVVRRPPQTLHDEIHARFHALREHEHPEVFRAVFGGGRVVAPDPLIVTRDLRVIVRSHYHPDEIGRSRVMARRLPRAKLMSGSAIALVTPWSHNHYHWLLDHLGRVPLLDDEPDLPVIVSPRLSAVQLESLALAGIDPARLRPLKHAHLQVQRLHWPSLLGETGHFPRWAMQRLRERLSPRKAASSHGRIYVVRRSTDERRIVNDDEVQAFLRGRGFDIVDPADMTFGEQRDAFASAGLIVGPHGAGMSNIVMSHDATVVELFSPAYVNGSCYTVADALGHAYWYLIGESTRGRDSRVDLALLEATLDKAMRKPS